MLQYRKYTEIITPHSHNVTRRNAACTDSFGHTYECSNKVSPAGAFPYDAALTFSLGCSDIPERASLYIHADGLSSGKGEQGMRLAMERSMCDGGCLFFVRIERGVLARLSEGGLFYYRYELDFRTDTDSDYDEGEAGRAHFCGGSDGSSDFLWLGGEAEQPQPMSDGIGERQLLLYRPERESLLPGGFIYHIFVDRFASSGKHNVRAGGIAAHDWYCGDIQHASVRGGELKNDQFFGGDLDGITDKLDYLASLGVTVIYLSPIFDSPSNHKYDTADYMRIDPAFGDDESFSRLCREAEARGVSILLDGVFNHTGADSRYFDIYSRYGGGAYKNPDSPYRSWYNFGATDDEYECWWGIKILPRVNGEDPGYRRFIVGEDGVIRKYMRLGAAGFRLDVADELSDGFIADIHSAVREEREDGAIIGEVWEDASNKIAYGARRSYLLGGELDSVMNYPMREAIIGYVMRGDAELFRSTAVGIYRRYPRVVSDSLMNLLGTHDTERILTVLGGISGDGKDEDELCKMRMTTEQRKKALSRLRCAFTILFTVYGVPSVFYGDEAGIEGYHDPFCRRPYPWGREDVGLRDYVTRLGGLRRRYRVYAHGLFRICFASPELLVFSRGEGSDMLYTAVSRTDIRYTFTRPVSCICTSAEPPQSEDGCTYRLEPNSAYIFAAGVRSDRYLDNTQTNDSGAFDNV